MVPAYEHMRAFLDAETPRAELFSSTAPTSLRMIWKSCLDVDFSTIPYDCVVTSPPYINLELYEHMPQWKSDELFYTTFLVPLWKKCRAHIKSGGHICFNISPMMYEQAQKFGLPACDEEEFLKQQMGQRMSSLKRGTKKHDKIYVWKCS
jgi:DNA modification methylase